MTTKQPIYNPEVQIETIHDTTAQVLIHTTEDKLRLALIDFKTAFAQRNAWHTPLGIFASLLLTQLTATFDKPRLGIPAEKVELAVWVLTVLSAVWLGNALFLLRRCPTVEDLLRLFQRTTAGKTPVDRSGTV